MPSSRTRRDVGSAKREVFGQITRSNSHAQDAGETHAEESMVSRSTSKLFVPLNVTSPWLFSKDRLHVSPEKRLPLRPWYVSEGRL